MFANFFKQNKKLEKERNNLLKENQKLRKINWNTNLKITKAKIVLTDELWERYLKSHKASKA